MPSSASVAGLFVAAERNAGKDRVGRIGLRPCRRESRRATRLARPTFVDHTLAERPYSESLANATASASSLKRTNAATGPKSLLARRDGRAGPRYAVASQNVPPAFAPPGMRCGAAGEPRAPRSTDLASTLRIFSKLLGQRDGADVRERIFGIADAEPLCPLEERLHEAIVDRKRAARRANAASARLPGVVVDCPYRRPATAASRSASSKTSDGDLPRVPKVTPLDRSAAAVARRSCRSAVLPVKATLWTSGWFDQCLAEFAASSP